MSTISRLTVSPVGLYHPTRIQPFHVLRRHYTQRYAFGLDLRLLWSPASMGRHGICLLGIIALAMDTSTSMLEQIGYSNIFSIFSNLLLGYAYDPYRGLHEVHRRFIPSGDCLPSQRQAHLYNLLWLDDRLCQSGVCVADGDQFLLSLHLSDESLEDKFIDTNA